MPTSAEVFLGKKNKHQPLHPFRGHIPLVPATNKKHLKELQKFCPKVAEVAYRALLLLLLYHISSTVIQNRPTSFLTKSSIYYVWFRRQRQISWTSIDILLFWSLQLLGRIIFFTPKNGGSLQWGFKLPSLGRCSFQLCCKAAFKKFTLFPPVQRLGHVWHHGNLRVPRNATSPLT